MILPSNPALIFEATRELGLTQRALAELIGVSLRTVQRNLRAGGISTAKHVHALAAAVYPKNPTLAAKLAALVHTDLVQLGLQPARIALPPPPAPPPRPPARREHADSVLCAAADALQMTPANARPFVAAVFSRARELGVDLDGLAGLFMAEGARAAKPSSPR